MEGQVTFFAGSNRKVILGSPTLQSTSRRICIPLRMPLTGESFVGMPDWVSEAFEAVSKYLTEASPQIQQVADLMLAFHNDAPKDELFAPPSAKAPGCELKAFSVSRVDDPDDDPTVELQFKAYIPFTRDIWSWIGEMVGHEVYMAFPSSLGKTAGTVTIEKPAAYDDPEMEAERVEALKPEHDAEFEPNDDMPDAPTVGDEFGPEYEDQVRQSMGAPEPFGDKPRLVDARPGRGKNKGSVQSKAKSGARKSLAVN